MISRRDRVLVVAAVVTLTLAACASGEPAAPTPSTGVTTQTEAPATAEPAPTDSAQAVPEVPAAAQKQDRPGAGAFVRYWFDLVNHAYRTGNTEPLKSLSDSDCKTCKSVVSSIEEAYSDGGSITGGHIQVLVAVAAPLEPDGIAIVSTVYEQQPMKVLKADGAVASNHTDPERATIAFYAKYQEGRWTAFGVTRES
jgi:hypothetical protein